MRTEKRSIPEKYYKGEIDYYCTIIAKGGELRRRKTEEDEYGPRGLEQSLVMDQMGDDYYGSDVSEKVDNGEQVEIDYYRGYVHGITLYLGIYDEKKVEIDLYTHKDRKIKTDTESFRKDFGRYLTILLQAGYEIRIKNVRIPRPQKEKQKEKNWHRGLKF